MKERPTIFVSAVSSEFGSFRLAVRDVLLAKDVFPIVQDHFPPDYLEVREMLTEKIRESDAMICLSGFVFGAEPKNRPAEKPRRSYTQLEYDIARELKKPVYLFLSDDKTRPSNSSVDEDEEKRRLQLEHRSALMGGDQGWSQFASKEDLKNLVAQIWIVAQAGFKISVGRLPPGPENLVGREKQLDALDAAWNDPKPKIITIVAWGGVGKTSLVAHWMAQMAADDWRTAERVFGWSFYSQGTREQTAASSDQFIAHALEFFGDPDPTQGSPWSRGERLARLVAKHKSLLVLDGLEPLQYPPGPEAGKLKDAAVEALLKGLAQHNPGLCIVTTRESVDGLKTWRTATAPEWRLEHLSEEASAALLRQTGVQGTDTELREASREVRGHALTLTLLGRYLALAHDGDIRLRDRVKFEEADAETQGGHAFRVMTAYERWFNSEGEHGRRALAVLRLLGLFDRPADAGCLKALRRKPAIHGLTEALINLSDEQWNITIKRLEQCGLLVPAQEQVAIDAHPLLREYFAVRVRDHRPEAWREGHRRLYEHLKGSVPDWPEGLDGLQPLYQAVTHGCQAGLHEDARAKVYRDRILRGTAANGFYSIEKLGAFGADLGAVACFFEERWKRLAPALSEDTQAWLLNQAAVCLRALGRSTEALEPMRVSTEMDVAREKWTDAAISANNLSELELTLGEVAAAVRDAEQSVDFAERSGDAVWPMCSRTALADALHQAGRRAEALECFREAEGMQAERQPHFPLLYSLQGFQYCDLLLSDAERAAWQRAAGYRPAGVSGEDNGTTVIVAAAKPSGGRRRHFGGRSSALFSSTSPSTTSR
jgi:hypothetical protein